MTEPSEIQIAIKAARDELARLDALDAERAASVVPASADGDDWSQPQPEPIREGDWISFYGTFVLSVGDTEIASFKSITTRFGMDLQLTPELIEFNSSLWSMVDDPDAQESRWAKVMLARGQWPDTTPRWERGSYEEDVQRDAARAAAFAIPEPEAQRRALREVDDRFGLRRTSWSTAQYYGGSGR